MVKAIAVVLAGLLLAGYVTAQQKMSDREHDGFVGPVKKGFVEWTPVSQPRNGISPGTRCRQMTDVYNEVGRLIQHSVYPGPCGSDEIRDDYTYVEDGSRMAKTQEIRGKDSPPPPPPVINPSIGREAGQPKEVRRYDSSGRKIESALISPSGKIAYKTAYSYDTKGRLVEITGIESDQPTSRRVYSYEGDQRVPSSFTYFGRDGKVSEKTVYTEYEFNAYGDWVQRKQFTEGTFNRKSTSLMIRNIEYYEGGGPAPRSGENKRPQIKMPRLLNNPRANYTDEAAKNRVEGIVRLRIVVGADGKVKRAEVINGLPDGLNQEAVRAAFLMKFEPATADGKPVAYVLPIDVQFKR